jgi:hypothetical protein
MSEDPVQYHIYQTEMHALVGSWDDDDDDEPYPRIYPNGGLPRAPASMLYIHGYPESWAKLGLEEWLTGTIMPLLVDENPARVVWQSEALNG